MLSSRLEPRKERNGVSRKVDIKDCITDSQGQWPLHRVLLVRAAHASADEVIASLVRKVRLAQKGDCKV